LQALRKKVPAKVFLGKSNTTAGRSSRPVVASAPVEDIVRRELTDDDISKLRELASEIKGKNVLVLNEDLEIVKNVSVMRVGSVDAKDAFVLMVSEAGGTVVQAAEKFKSKAVAAKTFGKVPETSVKLVSL